MANVTMDNIKALKKLHKSKKYNSFVVNQNNNEKKGVISKQYKTLDNLVDNVDSMNTEISDVKQLSENMFSTYLYGSELATMFISGRIVFDPSMQRGVKPDKKGNIRANFQQSHVQDIYTSMREGVFTPTQINLAVISDDDIDTEIMFEDDTLFIEGKIRLLDGQHRVRALVKWFNELKNEKPEGVNIDDYIFNVSIHYVTADEARQIYANIDKNLKLDKSQVRHLSSDYYAKVVNFLNTSSSSDMRGKIATSKPVSTRLVLFSTLSDAIKDSITINSAIERKEVEEYLAEFFNYVTYKLPEAFGSDEQSRLKFKQNNILNENIFFYGWMAIAFNSKEGYKKNIDKIVSNIEVFQKDNSLWLEKSVVKYKAKGEGFAMNNSTSGIKAVKDFALKVISE